MYAVECVACDRKYIVGWYVMLIPMEAGEEEKYNVKLACRSRVVTGDN